MQKSVINDPVKKAVYQAKTTLRKNAYNLALADAMNAPVIRSIKTDNYHGQPGNTITIRAIDDFKITVVRVTIIDTGGTLIEQGGAIVQPGAVDWIYTSTIANPQISGSRIIVTASDLPGNATRQEMVV